MSDRQRIDVKLSGGIGWVALVIFALAIWRVDGSSLLRASICTLTDGTVSCVEQGEPETPK